MSKSTKTDTKKAKNARKQKKDRKRHVRIYSFLWTLLHRPIKSFFRCDAQHVPEIDGSYLVLSNHNTDFDFLFVGTSFKKHMYFVISEHTMQHGFASKLLNYYLAPISRLKGATAASTAMNVIRTLRSGANVCIFAEGNRSFNGETCPILPSTGKLARSSGASLVTYRLEGGYLASPRWSYSLRRGKMRGSLVNIYSPEQLRSMTDDQVNDAIVRDLYENAYTKQDEWHAVYKGKRLAEGLEHILFLCPNCGRISSITSHKNKICCECGLEGTYDKYGYLNDTPYRTVLDWDKWQQERLPEIIDSAESDDSILFEDEDISLITVDSDHKPTTITAGKLSMSRNSLIINDHIFPLSEIEGGGLGIYSHSATVFSHNGIHYELKSEKRFCAVKYVRAYDYICKKDSEPIEANA